MSDRLLVLCLMSLLLARTGAEGRCGERLERVLDLMQQRGNGASGGGGGGGGARRRYDAEDPDAVYRQKLRSAPIEVTVTKLAVEIPRPAGGSSDRDGLAWAKVERCSYEPSSSSIRTRVGFGELAVSGLVQLVAYDSGPTGGGGGGGASSPRKLLPAESCRMSLRLRRAGMEFYTSPIARGRGQMRIRTESSFLEPRFASIYAYGCRPLGGGSGQPPPVRRPQQQQQQQQQRPHQAYDRVLESEPRKREIGLSGGHHDSNSVFGCGADCSSNETGASLSADDDIAEDEDRLATAAASAASPRPGPGGVLVKLGGDALLDSMWRSRGDIAREMEDVFLRTASQAITHYIERQLHPAIKETLMLSMGYTISYGR